MAIGLDQVRQELEGESIITIMELDVTDYYFIDHTDFVEYKKF